jgi:ribosomal protein S6--L-glutamate ligase
MPAGSLEQIIFRMDAIHAEARAGKRIINPPRAMETCIDKYLCTMRLAHAGLPVPRTVVSQDCDSAMSAFEALGRDVVVKPIFGSEGRGMVRITDAELAWRTFKALEHTGSVIYLQEYIRHPGWDVRAFVIGNRVVACMKRTSHGDWRTNVAQGGTTERYSLSQEETDLALNAARATGAIVAGVDLIQNHRGEWLILEVNAAPGWKALAQTCDIDIARLIVRHLQEWPT